MNLALGVPMSGSARLCKHRAGGPLGGQQVGPWAAEGACHSQQTVSYEEGVRSS